MSFKTAVHLGQWSLDQTHNDSLLMMAAGAILMTFKGEQEGATERELKAMLSVLLFTASAEFDSVQNEIARLKKP